jgi:hypothetical protein
MYVVEIWDSKAFTSAGPVWFTDHDMTLPDARAEAAKWIEDTGDSDRYQIVARIVGCL